MAAPTEVSWFQEHAELSLRLIRDAGVGTAASINLHGAQFFFEVLDGNRGPIIPRGISPVKETWQL
jgi:hypothetical protein